VVEIELCVSVEMGRRYKRSKEKMAEVVGRYSKARDGDRTDDIAVTSPTHIQ
jgi:hypothetical protein